LKSGPTAQPAITEQARAARSGRARDREGSTSESNHRSVLNSFRSVLVWRSARLILVLVMEFEFSERPTPKDECRIFGKMAAHCDGWRGSKELWN
jgi:hypothetical protein